MKTVNGYKSKYLNVTTFTAIRYDYDTICIMGRLDQYKNFVKDYKNKFLNNSKYIDCKNQEETTITAAAPPSFEEWLTTVDKLKLERDCSSSNDESTPYNAVMEMINSARKKNTDINKNTTTSETIQDISNENNDITKKTNSSITTKSLNEHPANQITTLNQTINNGIEEDVDIEFPFQLVFRDFDNDDDSGSSDDVKILKIETEVKKEKGDKINTVTITTTTYTRPTNSLLSTPPPSVTNRKTSSLLQIVDALAADKTRKSKGGVGGERMNNTIINDTTATDVTNICIGEVFRPNVYNNVAVSQSAIIASPLHHVVSKPSTTLPFYSNTKVTHIGKYIFLIVLQEIFINT